MPKPFRDTDGPRHVAIIMDGNGRWAQTRNRPRLFGHQRGAKRVREVVEACPLLALLYLNNNLHAAHHRWPRLPWYQLPQRWRLRDLAALLFSTLDLGYSRRDWLRFVR